MMCLKMHLHNSGMNSTFKEKIEKTFSAQGGHAVETEQDSYGWLLLGHESTHLHQKKPVNRPNQTSISDGEEELFSPIIPVSALNAKCGNSSSPFLYYLTRRPHHIYWAPFFLSIDSTNQKSDDANTRKTYQ